jgi:hypothetical protein
VRRAAANAVFIAALADSAAMAEIAVGADTVSVRQDLVHEAGLRCFIFPPAHEP